VCSSDLVLFAAKGKRGVNWGLLMGDEAHRFGVEWDTLGKMIHGIEKGKPRNLNKKLMELANSRTTEFDVAGEGQITFINGAKSVVWYVDENNRSVERCRKSKVGQLFFTMLSNVEWTRNTGGEIVGKDEYNRDDDYAGGSGNYVTGSYGK